MAAGIELYNDVLNQKGSPALYSDIFANRPTFGYTGRLFISTDTNEIYRDTGTSWVLISGSGTSVNIYNSNGSLTAARTMTMAGFNLIFEGSASASDLIISANAGVNRDLSFATAGVARWDNRVTDAETGSNAGANYYLKAYDDAGVFLRNVLTAERKTGEVSFNSDETLSTSTSNIVGIYNVTTGTYTNANYTTGNPQGSVFNVFSFNPSLDVTFANSQFVATNSNICRFVPTTTQSITMTQGVAGLRTIGPAQNQVQYNTPASVTLTVSHLCNYTSLGVYNLGTTGDLCALNAYHIILNDLNEYSQGTLTLHNRWGIYQASANDINYFNANTLFGTTTNAGYKIDVSGTARVTQSAYFATSSGSVGIGTTIPLAKLDIQDASNATARIRTFTSGNASLLIDSVGGAAIFDLQTSAGLNRIVGGSGGTSNLAFFTASTERMRIDVSGNLGIAQTTFGSAATKTLAINTGTAPGSSPADCFQLYSADITAGNAAAHFRTENGAIVKVYQETTAVGSATISSPGGGVNLKDDDTFDGYTLAQIVKALRNQGLLA